MKFICKVLALAWMATVASSTDAEDQNENCADWADSGECASNAPYMLANCPKSCQEVKEAEADAGDELDGVTSFFNLSANDIHGVPFSFSELEGDVTVITNVASYCGYTDSHYRQLVNLYREVKDTNRVNIMAFPCNQFGKQEPESNENIYKFALGYGVQFRMMEKLKVNGPGTSVVYRYLKKMAGPDTIGWNFASYYLVAPDGTVTSHNGVEPMMLKDPIMRLVDTIGHSEATEDEDEVDYDDDEESDDESEDDDLEEEL